jgi:hypothetical protein
MIGEGVGGAPLGGRDRVRVRALEIRERGLVRSGRVGWVAPGVSGGEEGVRFGEGAGYVATTYKWSACSMIGGGFRGSHPAIVTTPGASGSCERGG